MPVMIQAVISAVFLLAFVLTLIYVDIQYTKGYIFFALMGGAIVATLTFAFYIIFTQ